MTDVGTLLDQLHDWIVAYDPVGKTYDDFDRELVASNAELMALVSRRELPTDAVEAYFVVMSLADARGFFPMPDDDLNAPILREE